MNTSLSAPGGRSPSRPTELGVWLCVFLLARVGFLLTHGGSYIDEYLHIFSGEALVDHGAAASFYRGETYDRGLGVSWAVGLTLALFGRSLWAAKLVPLACGLLGLLCLFQICHRLWPRHAGPRGLACALFVLGPWTVFNHFYVRMYALYELGLLGTLWALGGLTGALHTPGRTGALRRALPWLSGLAAGQGLLLWLGREAGVLPVPLAACAGVAYLVCTTRPGEPERPPARASLLRRGLSLLALGALTLLLPPVREGLRFWRQGELHFSSSAEHKYLQLFFGSQLGLTVLFAVGLVVLLWGQPGSRSSRSFGRLTALVALGLFALHLGSSADLQITRGLLYFMPLYGIVTAASVARLPSLAVAAVALGNLALSYPSGFLREPGIPSEITYIEYGALYAEASRACAGSSIIDASPSPHIGLFHGVRPDLSVWKPSGSKQDLMLQGDGGDTRTVFGAIPAVTRLPRIDQSACLIVRGPSAGRLLSRRFRKALAAQPVVARRAGITLYRVGPGFLNRYRDL